MSRLNVYHFLHIHDYVIITLDNLILLVSMSKPAAYINLQHRLRWNKRGVLARIVNAWAGWRGAIFRYS